MRLHINALVALALCGLLAAAKSHVRVDVGVTHVLPSDHYLRESEYIAHSSNTTTLKHAHHCQAASIAT